MRHAAILSISMLFAVSGWGQTLTGTILGTVTDPEGAVLPGVELTITNTETNQVRTVFSSESGNYSAVNLPVGLYQVEAMLQGLSYCQEWCLGD